MYCRLTLVGIRIYKKQNKNDDSKSGDFKVIIIKEKKNSIYGK